MAATYVLSFSGGKAKESNLTYNGVVEGEEKRDGQEGAVSKSPLENSQQLDLEQTCSISTPSLSIRTFHPEMLRGGGAGWVSGSSSDDSVPASFSSSFKLFDVSSLILRESL